MWFAQYHMRSRLHVNLSQISPSIARVDGKNAATIRIAITYAVTPSDCQKRVEREACACWRSGAGSKYVRSVVETDTSIRAAGARWYAGAMPICSVAKLVRGADVNIGPTLPLRSLLILPFASSL